MWFISAKSWISLIRYRVNLISCCFELVRTFWPPIWHMRGPHLKPLWQFCNQHLWRSFYEPAANENLSAGSNMRERIWIMIMSDRRSSSLLRRGYNLIRGNVAWEKWNSLSSVSAALWANKNWTPSMKVKQIKDCINNNGLKGCKWSSLKVPGTETPVSHSGWENSIFSFSWGNKELALPSMKVNNWKNFRTKLA